MAKDIITAIAIATTDRDFVLAVGFVIELIILFRTYQLTFIHRINYIWFDTPNLIIIIVITLDSNHNYHSFITTASNTAWKGPPSS